MHPAKVLMKSIFYKLIINSTRNLIGLPSHKVKLGYGSFITMGFGQDKTFEVMINEQLTREVRPEWFLWIMMAAWRIDKNGIPICGCEDEPEEITQMLSELEGKKLMDIRIINQALDTQFIFQDGLALNTFSIYTHDIESENWSLCTPSKEVLSVYTTKAYLEQEVDLSLA